MNRRILKTLLCAVAVLSTAACSAGGARNSNAQKHTDAAVSAEIKGVTGTQRTAGTAMEKQSGAQTVSNAWFSYTLPAGLRASSNDAEDEEYRVYESKIILPTGGSRISSFIYVSYFAEDNEDIATYQEFIRVNSQNILRKTPSEWEKYEPVTETKIAGRKAYVVARNCRHFLNPNSKDDSYVMKKEKMYVLPASKGYYVIRYGAEENFFNLNIDTFEKIAASFKGKF